MPATRILIAVFAGLVSLLALTRIGGAIYEYELFTLEHGDTIDVRPAPPPKPQFMQPPPVRVTPPVERGDAVCDDSCWKRAVVTI